MNNESLPFISTTVGRTSAEGTFIDSNSFSKSQIDNQKTRYQLVIMNSDYENSFKFLNEASNEFELGVTKFSETRLT